MSQPIAIAGASVRAAAASAVMAGFQPIAADLFADADLRQIATATRISPYPEGLVDWLRAIEPPAWMYTGALENHPELVDQMAWIAPLWGNPGDVLQRIRSPRELAAVLAEAGLLFPDTRDSADALPQDGSWLAKTYHGASGSGVRELIQTGRQGDKETRRVEEAKSALESPCLPLSLSPGLVFQRRVDGVACSAIFVAAGAAAVLLGATRQLIGEPWLGAHGFQYAGSIGPLPMTDAVQATIARIGNVLAERFELTGLFGVDFILDGGHVWTLEVNPRYTASVEIIERATGVHAIAAHAAACRDGLVDHPWPARGEISRSHGKAIVFARRDMVITDALASMALAEAARRPWPTMADVSPAGTQVEAGRPIITIFAQGATVEQVEQRLRDRVADVESELYADS